MRFDQFGERMKVQAELVGLRFKFILMSLVRLAGIVLVLGGALPLFAPFLKASLPALPAFIEQAYVWEFSMRSIASIAVGSIVVWFST